jgi:TRAP-type C4-dicarboxylate transport system substrate-binding protein
MTVQDQNPRPRDSSRRRLVNGIGAAAIVSQVGLSKPARAQVKLRYANASNAQYQANVVMTQFWDEVRKRTNGEIVAETFWGTLTGSEQVLLNGVTLGTLDGWHGAYTGMREFDLFYTANLFRDFDHAARVVNGPLLPRLRQALEQKYKVHLLGLGRAGSFGLQMREPVRTWADLKNKKIRCGPLEGILESVKALGANAVPLPYGEAYGAMQQGVVDGQVNLNTLLVTAKFYEVGKYWITNEFGLGFDKVVIAQRVWSRMKPEHQKLLTELMAEMEPKVWYPPVRQRLDEDRKKWQEIHGKDSLATLDAGEAQRVLGANAERLANQIFGAGAYKQIQDSA